VWVLLCPRDYLSSYMKIGVIALLGVGIFVAHPVLKMPAVTPFIHGGGPVVSGTVWPFVCIVIMCGALSGFHALIASGTTPKMVNKESDIRPIAYGTMLLEGFVALMALVAACALEPGDYFKINVDKEKYQQFVIDASAMHGLSVVPRDFDELQRETGEKDLAGRTAGAVTLAVGMAKVFSSLPGMRTMMSYWYHFVIMFEALFILTLLETGTRVARFIFEETVSQFRGGEPSLTMAGRHKPQWVVNVLTSLLVSFLWGYLLYTGDVDRLWKMMGIANQLLATIALAVGTSYLLLHSPKRRYALCTFLPFVFVVATVFTAGIQSITMWRQKIAGLTQDLAALGAAGEKAHKMAADIFSLRLTSVLATAMLVLSALIVLDAVRRWYLILSGAVSPAAQLEPVAGE